MFLKRERTVKRRRSSMWNGKLSFSSWRQQNTIY